MTRDELIERVRQVIDDEVLTRTGRSIGDLSSGHVAHALADAGLLANPAEQDALQAKLEELTDFAGEQANARRESDRVRNLAAREAADLRDERDTARAQLAEKTEYAGEKAREGDVLSLQVDDLTAERDALQARLDTALARMKEADGLSADWPPSFEDWSAYNSKLIHARAALQGDQPAEPESRCMNGPAKQHTLRMVEIIKALRAATADGALPGELGDRASFAQVARAIVDHWPTGEAGRG